MGYLVSVIIAFLNEKRFLAEAIESVINQDYTNWELILVDDGSTDGSTEIAKNYSVGNPRRIIFTEHPNHVNKGLSASRNQGISLATGVFVAILDADDVWSPSKLQLQIDLMIANPEVMLLCEASEYWYSWNPGQSKQNRIVQVGKIQDKTFYPPQLMEVLYPLSDGDAPCPSGVIVRKIAVDKHSGFESQFTGRNQMYEDQAFFAKFYLNEPVYISSACNNRYRQREGSLVQKINNGGDYASVRKYYLDWLKNYLTQNHIEYKNVERLLKRAFEPYHQPTLYYFRKLFKRIGTRLKKI